MQRIIFFLLFIFSFAAVPAFSQQITYSDVNKDDNKRISFEILGNFNGNYIIYKNSNKKHKLGIYDKDMHLVNTIKLDYISDKTFNIDFVNYPDYFLAIYQYQKNNTVYCNAAKINSTGNIIGNVINLDTARTNFFTDNNKVYYLTNSEDKQKILLYKVQHKNNDLALSTKLYNSSMHLLDSTRTVFDYNDRKETYDDLEVSNDGTFLFAKETGNGRNDYSKELEINYRRPNTDSFITKQVLLDDKFVEDVKIKIDNLNNQYLVTSFSYKKNSGNIEGLFTLLINSENFAVTKKAITLFVDSTREMLSGKTDSRTAFNDFAIKKIVFKRDGGFILTTEEYYTLNRNNRLNSRDYYYNPYSYNPNFYGFQRDYYGYGYGYYRDPFRYSNNQGVLYNYNDVLIFSFNKDLQPEWNNIINKKQSDVDTDDFLSFSTINMGAEIHYLFLQKDNNKEVMSDHALQPDGQIIRNPTIKSGEAGYDFMPRLAKQVGSRQIIVPCILRGTISFAKIDFF